MSTNEKKRHHETILEKSLKRETAREKNEAEKIRIEKGILEQKRWETVAK